MQNPNQPPQETTDLHQRERTLHDAHLLLGGAEISNGQLHPTESQIKELRSTVEDGGLLSAVGSLALHNKALEDISRPMHELESESENTKKLQEDIDSALLPYLGIFDDKIPSGRRFDKRSEWSIDRVIKNRHVSHNFSLSSSRNSKQRKIDSIGMKFELPNKEDRQGLKINYSDTGQMDNIELTLETGGADTGVGYPGILRMDSPLAKFYEKLVPRHDTFAEANYGITLSFSLKEPFQLTAKHYYVLFNGLKVFDRPEATIDYSFNGARNRFEAVTREGKSVGPEEIDSTEYTTLVKDTLGLIPTVKQ